MKADEAKTNEELQLIIELLRESKLPYKDIVLDGSKLFMGYRDENNNLIASGGLELYSDHSLLRSVAVREDLRGTSIGKWIVRDLINRAKEKSIKEVYLLTETAHDFFIKLGFKDVSREAVPESIKTSIEFSSVCPVSAQCMTYAL
jgi:amino-acid N-acetyltransferase